MTREDIESMFAYQAADAAYRYAGERCHKNKPISASKLEAFEAGAEWAQEFMIKRACEWLRENTTWECNFYGGNNPNKNKIEDFRKAMEK